MYKVNREQGIGEQFVYSGKFNFTENLLIAYFD